MSVEGYQAPAGQVGLVVGAAPDLPPGCNWPLVGLYDSSGARLATAPPSASPPRRLGAWLERHTPYQAGPRPDGDRVILGAVDVGGRR